MDDHVSGLPKLVVPGKVNWELQDTFPGPEAEEGLEGGHRLLAAIVSEDKFVEVHLELTSAHAVIGPDQPLLEVANGTVRQGDDGLGAFPQVASQGLDARQVLESSFLQSGEALEPVGVDR